jgi:hypothetical protein
MALRAESIRKDEGILKTLRPDPPPRGRKPHRDIGCF